MFGVSRRLASLHHMTLSPQRKFIFHSDFGVTIRLALCTIDNMHGALRTRLSNLVCWSLKCETSFRWVYTIFALQLMYCISEKILFHGNHGMYIFSTFNPRTADEMSYPHAQDKPLCQYILYYYYQLATTAEHLLLLIHIAHKGY